MDCLPGHASISSRFRKAARTSTQRFASRSLLEVILVAGGSGRLGTLIVRRLAARGLGVRVLTRDRTRTAHIEGGAVEVMEGDVRDDSCLGAAMAGVETVVSAIHGFGDVGNVSPASI